MRRKACRVLGALLGVGMMSTADGAAPPAPDPLSFRVPGFSADVTPIRHSRGETIDKAAHSCGRTDSAGAADSHCMDSPGIDLPLRYEAVRAARPGLPAAESVLSGWTDPAVATPLYILYQSLLF